MRKPDSAGGLQVTRYATRCGRLAVKPMDKTDYRQTGNISKTQLGTEGQDMRDPHGWIRALAFSNV